MIVELTEKEFKSTLGLKMIDVTETGRPVIDIWPSLDELVDKKIVPKYVRENYLVEKVYRSDLNTFDHILLPTETAQIFIVIVIDIINKKISGYYKLDIYKEYGITKKH
jgi:hypothetical protein